MAAALTSELILLGVLTLLGSGTVAAVVAGLFGRRKISAEATEIVTRAAGAQVERLSRELQDVRAELGRERDARSALERKVDSMERREGVARDLMVVHAGWDYRASDVLRRYLTAEQLEDEQLLPPPPLYPPS